MGFGSFFIVLGILSNYLEKTTRTKSTLLTDTRKTSLDTSPPAKSLSLHCKKIGRIKNSVDEQSSTLLDYMQVSGYKTTFTPMLLVFLKVDTHHCYLDTYTLSSLMKITT